ncbi:HAE1 family hydrophobic/amphiphilic exporter-1 [Cryobacterium mesophilum]|uniref:Efflux RND transporter permease subunit n=1 Tax=Terrimesophilobacter mesophilus TaxID=433647 RepID=A0A4R8VC55_9MICO|nr:efflux RND transporter permease subunit [Terrimesophilobacter mesophilus]MBB5633252.1 HAE1 family hydrophobic/amphiphilic exporter-1 [Terrimesophilobacter mesophilus]TFB79996.1 efflux RND transporter permease subunit [Terrimesophilobacter mesophilus]
MHLLSVFSLRNRALIALVTIVVGVFGALALTSLKQELIPSVSFPQMVIVTSYPGAAPDVVNDDLSTPIETAIQGVPGLESTTATSTSNLSSVTAKFDYGTNLATAEQKVQQAINRISNTLPADSDPRILTGSIDDFPVVQLAVTSDLDENDLAALLESSTIVDLQKLDDVRAANLQGAVGQRVTITPDADKLRAAGLTVQAIRDALKSNGVLLPGGSITEDGKTLTVQSGSKIHTVDELKQLPLIGAGAGPAVVLPGMPPAAPPAQQTIGDVATVALVDNPVTSISRVNGEPSLTIGVTKTPDGNTVAVSKAVHDAIPGLEAALGSNTKFTVVFDQAPFIQQSIDSLASEGLLGLLFAVVVILIFLMSVRSTLVTAISIPVSVLITFIGMQATGYSLNILTLGALTIAIGRVVDDSIVVIENIKRHLALGQEKAEAILTAVKEVAAAITASTVTTVAVFLPIALVGDITGELFRPFALTITIALAASLFVALTIVPVLAYWFLGHPKPSAVASDAEVDPQSMEVADGHVVSRRELREGIVSAEDELGKPTGLQRAYLPVIHWTLKRPVATIIAAFLVLGGTVALVPSLTTNFIGESGQNTLNVTQTLPSGTSLDAMDTAATKVENALRDIEGIDTVQLTIGGGSSLATAFGGGGGITFSITTDPNVNQDALKTTVRDRLKELTGVGTASLSGAGSSFASSDIDVNITATTQDDLRSAADKVLAAVQDLPETAEATSNLANSQPYIAVVVDRDKAAEVGLSEIAIGSLVSQAMQPTLAGTAVIDDKTMSIYLQTADAPVTIAELRDLSIPTRAGTQKLSDLATVEQSNGPASITTIKGLRAATVSVTPKVADVTTASIAVQEAINSLDLPGGATTELGGVTSQQADAFSQLGLALLAAILIVYVVMVATFKSLRQPLLLLVSVPFAATGGIILQVLSGIPLGVPSLIGVLMLIGIVVTNAIVLVDLVNQYRERGMKVGEAIVHGASRRLRPILMTALATIFALLPMAVGLTGHGGFISQPLAIVVIGGLVSSTLLTLVVLPVLYYLVEGAKERRIDRRAARAAAAAG